MAFIFNCAVDGPTFGRESSFYNSDGSRRVSMDDTRKSSYRSPTVCLFTNNSIYHVCCLTVAV